MADREKTGKLSGVTVGFGIYIVASAAFMLQVRNWLFKSLGNAVMLNSVKLCFALAFVLSAIYAFKTGVGLFRVCILSLVFILGYLFSAWQPYFSEQTHVLTYGLLGYMAAGDLIKGMKNATFKNTGQTVCFVSCISASDEIFQAFLPYRVGDIRDVITNVISATLGIVLLLLLKDGQFAVKA